MQETRNSGYRCRAATEAAQGKQNATPRHWSRSGGPAQALYPPSTVQVSPDSAASVLCRLPGQDRSVP